MLLNTKKIPANIADTPIANPEKVVFLHGFMGRGSNFTSVAKALSDTTISLMIDAPNHAGSPWTDEISYAQMADATAETIISEFGTEPVNIVGHSMGGKTAMYLALTRPELVKRLVVVDISPTPRSIVSGFRALLQPLLELDLTTLESRIEADKRLSAAIPDPGTRSFMLQNLARTADGFRWEANIPALLNALPEIGDFPTLHKTFDKPTLWVIGGASNYVQDSDTELMESLFPDVVPAHVAGAGHLVHAEKPAEFIALLREFVEHDA